MNVKISGFYDEIDTDLQTQISVMKSLGERYLCPRKINGKNIAAYTPEEFEKTVYPVLKENGILFSSIGSPIGKVDIDDEEGYQRQLGQLKNLIEIAKLMECKYIRIFSFFIKDKNYEGHRDRVMEKMRGFLQVAEGSGVILLHENEKGIYGDNAVRCKDLYETLNHPDLQLAYDASNFIQVRQDPQEAFEMLKDYVVYYHMKDCDWETGVEVPLGTGDGQYKKLFAALKERNYEGFMTLEPHTAKYAVLKPIVYFIPFMPFILHNFYKGFRKIDKSLNVSFFKKLSREDVFRLQYKNLKSLLED